MTKRMKTAGPVNRNDDIALKIDSLGSEGQGVGRYEGLAVFVPFALPNEHVKAHIIKAASNYAVGKLIATGGSRAAPPSRAAADAICCTWITRRSLNTSAMLWRTRLCA